MFHEGTPVRYTLDLTPTLNGKSLYASPHDGVGQPHRISFHKKEMLKQAAVGHPRQVMG